MVNPTDAIQSMMGLRMLFYIMTIKIPTCPRRPQAVEGHLGDSLNQRRFFWWSHIELACPLQRTLGTKSAGCRMACIRASVSLACFLLHSQACISMCLCACVEVRRVGFLFHHGAPRIKGRLTVSVAKDACIFTLRHLSVHCFIKCVTIWMQEGIFFSFFFSGNWNTE